jgi:hypothetical protein
LTYHVDCIRNSHESLGVSSTNSYLLFLGLQLIDDVAASQQEAGALSLDFFRNHASPSWKTDDLVSEKTTDVDGKAKAENSASEHDLPKAKSPKDDPGTKNKCEFQKHFPMFCC